MARGKHVDKQAQTIKAIVRAPQSPRTKKDIQKSCDEFAYLLLRVYKKKKRPLS